MGAPSSPSTKPHPVVLDPAVASTGPHINAVPIPNTAALRAVLFDADHPMNEGHVKVVDTPEQRVHDQSHLLGVILCGLGIALVLLGAVFAQRTVDGVTQDVGAGFAALLGQVLTPLQNALDGLVLIAVPIAVLIEMSVKRLGRQIIEAMIGGILGLLLGFLAYYLISHFGIPELVDGFSVGPETYRQLVIPSYLAGMTAGLTVAGPRTRRRSVRWGWNLLIGSLILVVVTNQVPLAGALLAVLIGRGVGQAVQYFSGVNSERAYGDSLIEAVRNAGFQPAALVRVRDISQASGVEDLGAIGDPHLTTTLPNPADEAATATSSDPAAVALTRAGGNRIYAMLDTSGERYDVVVLDGDRLVLGVMARWWRTLRLRGIEGRAVMSLKTVAERTTLMSYAATAAGVRTPRLLGMGMAEESAALVMEHASGTVSLRDLSDKDLAGSLGDDLADEAWAQLLRAHAAGLTHHQLTADVLLVQQDNFPVNTPAGDTQLIHRPRVWITGWEQGEVASPTLSRRFDMTQLLGLLALRIGPERAVTSAVRALPDADLSALGPLLQTIALPTDTRVEMRHRKGLINELRDALVSRLPETTVQPARLTRFGARTIIMLSLSIVAVVVITNAITFEEIQAAVAGANPWWVAASFMLVALTWVGSALMLTAFTPVKVPLTRAILSQMAGSFVALVTPAGIGPAALNMRFLTRRGVTVPMAVATAALSQVAGIVITVVLLIVLVLVTGTGALVQLPGPTVLMAVGLVGLALVIVLLIPTVRKWVWAKVRPVLEQVWPRLSSMLGQPLRLATGVGGSILMSVGYVLSFNAALLAFGFHRPLPEVAVIYLIGNTVGAMAPTPGGLGAIEVVLAAGLVGGLGIPFGIATAVAFVFRLASYWGRVPIGWVAIRYLEKKGDL